MIPMNTWCASHLRNTYFMILSLPVWLKGAPIPCYNERQERNEGLIEMNETDMMSREPDAQAQETQQPESPVGQIANMDYSDFVSLLMESRII